MVICVVCELFLKAIIKNNQSQAGEGCFSKGPSSTESILVGTPWCPDSRARGRLELSLVGCFYPQMGKTTWSVEHGSIQLETVVQQHADQVA